MTALRPVADRWDRFAEVEQAVATIAAGGIVIIVDDADRENEGDLVAAAQGITAETVNFMATVGRGLICCAMERPALERLQVPAMTSTGTDPHGTAFHVGVDLVDGGTGISATDRAACIGALADPATQRADLRMPGHVFPLGYDPRGVLGRRGHTEASVDIARLAGLAPAAAICEIAAPDGQMARMPALRELADEHGLPLITIDALVAYRQQHEQLVERVAEAALPLPEGQFRAVGHRGTLDGAEYVTLVHGAVAQVRDAVPVRLHRECFMGDVFGSTGCGCAANLHAALDAIVEAGAGVLIYSRERTGALGVDAAAAQVLRDLAVGPVELLTVAGEPPDGLADHGVDVVCRTDLAAPVAAPETVRRIS